MHAAKIVLAVGVALVGGVVVPAVHAQETKNAQEAKQPADLRLLLTQPQNRVPADSTGTPNLRDLPMPKMDKPPVQPPITIMLGDPRCSPGEDGFGDFAPVSRRSRRSH